MRALVDALLAVLIAPPCAACGDLLDRPSCGPVCPGCWSSVRLLTPPLCDSCGDPLPGWRAVTVPLALCPRCRRTRRSVKRARAVGVYDGPLRSIVHALKYEGRRSLAPPLARLMREQGRDILEGAHAAIPVPLHPLRRLERGFNQANDLAQHLGLPVVRALRRLRATADQALLPAARRHANVRGAFGITAAARGLAGLTVVLVDDVSTTGATLESCGRALLDAGVREVRALTAARVVSGSRPAPSGNPSHSARATAPECL